MKKILLIVVSLCVCELVYAQQKGFETSLEANVGIGLDDYTKYTFGVNVIGGYRFNDFISLSAGIGYTYLNGLYYSNYEYLGKGDSYRHKSYDVRSNLNVFARAKINMTKTKVSPFILVDLGGTFGLASSSVKMANGFMYEPALGCDFKLKEKHKVYVMLGYKGMKYEYSAFDTTFGSAGEDIRKTTANSFCIHLGFTF